MIKKEFTTAEVNSAVQNLREMVNKSKLNYPVSITYGPEGMIEAASINDLNLNEPSSARKVYYEAFPKKDNPESADFCINVTLGEYKWMEDGKEYSIVLPLIGGMNKAKYMRVTGEILDIAEAFRNLATIFLMTIPEIEGLSPLEYGAALSDALSNGDAGTSQALESLIKSKIAKITDGGSREQNKIFANWETDRIAIPLKNAIFNSQITNFAKGFKGIADIMEKDGGKGTSKPEARTTNISPTVAEETSEKITEVSSVARVAMERKDPRTLYGQNK